MRFKSQKSVEKLLERREKNGKKSQKSPTPEREKGYKLERSESTFEGGKSENFAVAARRSRAGRRKGSELKPRRAGRRVEQKEARDEGASNGRNGVSVGRS